MSMFELLRVLVVDDDEFDFKVIKRHLETVQTTDYQLIWVESIEDARRALNEHEIDAALIDYRLNAGESGIDFVKELGGREAEFPIIMLTGFGDYEFDSNALLAGAFDYLDKAMLTRELVDRAIRFAIISHQNENMLRASFCEAAEQAEINRRILSIVSHEMKSPIGAIREYSDQILNNGGGDAHPSAAHIKSASIHLEDFIRNLSEFVRLNSSAARVTYEDFQLKTMLTETVDFFMPFARHKSLKLKLDLDPSTDGFYSGDSLRIRHILINLIKNAIKYSEKGAITVSAKVEGDKLRVSVEDEGVGMSADQIEQISSQKDLVHAPGAEVTGGLGIGLSICHGLVRLLEGDMKLESEVGAGTKAYFELPLERARNAKVA